MNQIGSRNEARVDSRHRRKNNDIEVLRAFAILFVLVEHSSFNQFKYCEPFIYRIHPFLRFSSGVDLFFVISGFVIARTLLPELYACLGKGSARPIVFAFWLRRATRLIPSAWLWLGLILVGAAFYNRSGAWGSLHTNLVSTATAILDLQNVRVIRPLNVSIGASFPYWSLSLEEQFYVLLPIAALLARKALPLLLAAVVGLELLVNQLGSLTLSGIIFYAFRTDGLAFGVLLALWSGRSSWARLAPMTLLRLGPARALVTLALLGLVALGAGYGQQISPHGLGWVALSSALLVFVASFDRDFLWPIGASRRVLLWIGSRSYGIYIVHIPCYFFVRETWFRATDGRAVTDGIGGYLTALIGLILVAAVAELNYRYVESPCREIGRRWALRIRPGGSGAWRVTALRNRSRAS